MDYDIFLYEIEDFPLDNYNILLNEALFHNANGYLGVRYDFEEEYPQGFEFIKSQYINGIYDETEVSHPEHLYGFIDKKQFIIDVADTQTIKLYLGQEAFSMFEGTCIKRKLSLHMDKGLTIREVHWRSPSGKEILLKITRMVSFVQPSLFTIEYEVTPLNFSGEMVIESIHDVDVENFSNPSDPRTASYLHKCINPTKCEMWEDTSFISSITTKSNIQVSSGVKNVLSKGAEIEFYEKDNTRISVYHVEGIEKEKITLLKYAVFCDSRRETKCRERVNEEMDRAISISIEDHYRNQKEYLDKYWENCQVHIHKDKDSDLALRYNLYQLLQSAGRDSKSSISPKGLSGEGYEGHYFWDSEMYIQPFFTITNPEISKNLLNFRYETLEAAKENAHVMGHMKGALYPWRTINGAECSGYYPSGSAQYHINGAVAYALIAYFLATDDIDFLLEKGAEILFETARFWVDISSYYEGQFHINDVTGPDEYTCIVNNNYYTNVLAQYHLQWAVKIYNKYKDDERFQALIEKIALTGREIEEFKGVGERIYLPYDKEKNINPQDDSFLKKCEWTRRADKGKKDPLFLHYHPLHLFRHQVCKQADTVLAHFILEDAQTEDVIRSSYLYYEERTVHDSSLSRSIFSIMAARLGMIEKAVSYLGESLKTDLKDLLGNTKDGIHTANMGGSYMVIVHGFAGFRLKENGIFFNPVLPEGWEGYDFKICYRKKRIKLEVNKKGLTFYLEIGDELEINVYGESYLLKESLFLPLPGLEKKEKGEKRRLVKIEADDD